MSEATHGESFTQFKQSFSYGSRTDLNFKFLKNLSDDAAARFIQELFSKLGDTLDDGDVQRIVDHIRAGQRQAYVGPAGNWQYADGPFAPLQKGVADARLMLITSSGHFVDGEDPTPFGILGMTQEEVVPRVDDFLKEPPTLSAIPMDTPPSRLHVRHPGYDVRGAASDPGVVLPLAELRALEAEGRIGALAANAYTFVGACAQTPLIKRTGPEWVRRWQSEGIDGALLVPV